MKKTYSLVSANKNKERHVEAIKHELKKYMARESRKDLPENHDTWFFDCRFGDSEQNCQALKISDINKSIDEFTQAGKDSFYIEIIARASAKPKRT